MNDALPLGYRMINVRTVHLEMLRNEVPEAPDLPEPWQIVRWVEPPLDEYRDLFRAVGGDWGWAGSLMTPDAEMVEVLNDDRTEVWRLVASETRRAAGFIQLDRLIPGEVEIVYFGLTPEFIRLGLGSLLLRWAIHHAWTSPVPGPNVQPTKRLWLHTCDFDSPAALPTYRKAGFRIFEETEGPEAYPETFIARRESASAG
ncbi:MAG TPA: GNAT family N-acetyltransferase [Candidatus Limnocylindrales bacterium]